MRRPNDDELRVWLNNHVTQYLLDKLSGDEKKLVRQLEDPESEVRSPEVLQGLRYSLKAVRAFTRDPQELLLRLDNLEKQT